MTENKTRNQHKRHVMLSAASVMVIAQMAPQMAPPAYAVQDQDTTDLEEVVVTGSRIKRDSNLAGSAPVDVVSARDLQLSGEINVAELLQDQPALLTSVTSDNSLDSPFFSGFNGRSAVGQSVLQLRGLGPARTLVLVNGRRHVSGVSGTQSVDISSIPSALIESVETLTGGASSVYGADAVTGVVNFVLKDDFEGLDVTAQGSLTEEGDGERGAISVLYGQNFADDKGNFTAGIDYTVSGGIRADARRFTNRSRRFTTGFPNPDLRFQGVDISASDTPNFSRFFAPNNGLFRRGIPIPSAADFTSDFEDAFGVTPNLTPAELALIARAENAPPLAVLNQLAFSITSSYGVIAPADFSSPDIDLDGNGTPDCIDSFTGFNSSFDFSGAFGLAGGCWVNDPNTGLRPVRDGLVVGDFNHFGGDGILATDDRRFVIPDDEKVAINLTGSYEISPGVRVFGEAKYVRQDTRFGGDEALFLDLLTVAPDNPFIPSELAGIAASAGGLFMTIDPAIGPNRDENERETYRAVAGIEGEMSNGWTFEVSANYGRFEQTNIEEAAIIMDRFFASIDAVDDGNGNAVCRSDSDPTAPPTTIFDIPAFSPGYFTFNPGDGSCSPINLFGLASGDISQEALDFVTTTLNSDFVQEQFVATAFVAGDSADYFELPGGPVAFVIGGEYRDEKAESTFDDLALGICPVTTPDCQAGQRVSDLGLAQLSLINAPNNFDSGAIVNNAGGGFDVWELFAEVSLPLLADVDFAKELRVDASARFSDYSTVGSTFVWNAGIVWAPIDDITLRGSYSRSIRAPNINELFSPEVAGFFRPVDPCDVDQINALLDAGDPRGQTRQANCAADGLPADFQDPLSARFTGAIAGNENLTEETADTFTVGLAFEPSFLPGFSLTVDYWNIEIADAIALVSAQDIVDSCYDSSDFANNQFCPLFDRNSDPNSAQFGGFTFLLQTQQNFAALEAAGIDFSARYLLELGDHRLTFQASGTWTDKINRFFDPSDLTVVDPELGELGRPEWAGNASVTYEWEALTVRWSTRYQDAQAFDGIEVETADSLYGEGNGFTSDSWIHDASASYQLTETLRLFGGVNNIGNRKPFLTELALPVSLRGRSFFLGVNARF